MDLRAIAAKLTLSDLQELIVRFAINEIVCRLLADGRRMTETAISGGLNMQRMFQRLQTNGDIRREITLLMPMYVNGGWKEESVCSDKIVRMSAVSLSVALDALVEMNAADRDAMDKYDKDERKEALERIAARSAAIDQLEA